MTLLPEFFASCKMEPKPYLLHYYLFFLYYGIWYHKVRSTTGVIDEQMIEMHQRHCDNLRSLLRFLQEQIRRKETGRKDFRMPFRPDHGVKMLDDFNRTANPGYPLIGRLKGLSEIAGMQKAIERELTQ